MAVSCEAALRMLRERARQFVSNGMAACVASANDSLFELTKAARMPPRKRAIWMQCACGTVPAATWSMLW